MGHGIVAVLVLAGVRCGKLPERSTMLAGDVVVDCRNYPGREAVVTRRSQDPVEGLTVPRLVLRLVEYDDDVPAVGATAAIRSAADADVEVAVQIVDEHGVSTFTELPAGRFVVELFGGQTPPSRIPVELVAGEQTELAARVDTLPRCDRD